MALKIKNKIDVNIKFFYRKNSFLTRDLRGIFYNVIIEPYFDNACPGWYPNLTKENKLCKINAYGFALDSMLYLLRI